jgi:hypothetical protein
VSWLWLWWWQYIDKLGFPTDLYRFVDVLSTEDWALEMVPKPALAVVMLFPIKDAVRGRRRRDLHRCVCVLVGTEHPWASAAEREASSGGGREAE